ncbi:MAG: phosphoglucosamine mutase [Blastocatellia bacterium]|jgi:phosphoglucosamine mutase
MRNFAPVLYNPAMQRQLFGTDGIRGKAGEFPLDDGTVFTIGRALARVLALRLGRPPKVVLGRDTRESGPRVEAELAAGIHAEGGEVDVSGVISTPGIAVITRLEGYDAGVIVTASHNPFNDNGIKVFSPSGRKLDEEAERAIEALVHEADAPATSEIATVEEQPWHADHYREHVRTEVAAGLDLTGLSVVLDCANGAAYEQAPRLFRELGASVSAIGVEPDGRNINKGCGSLHLAGLQSEVAARGADIGVAFDGDADRALFVDANASVVDGDRIMFLLAMDLDARGQLEGRRVVATVMSNIGLEIALKARGIELSRADVGDKYVLEELLTTGASVGGEQSGHVIFPRISLAGDGMVTALEVLRAMRREGRSLSELASGMETYPQILVNVPVLEKRPFGDVPAIAATAAEVERELAGSGRLLLRYSGTERLARVMIEGRQQAVIAQQAERIAAAIRATLG